MSGATQQQMQEITHYPHGAFSWIDLLTPNVTAAKEFYGSLFGWTFQDVPMGDGYFYTFANLYDKPIGGMMQIPDHAAVWQNYVTVDNADTTAAKVREAGGVVLDDAVVSENGRMMRFYGPGKGEIAAWQPYNFAGSAFKQAPGAPAWHELWTDELEADLEFYRQVFGWRCELQTSGELTHASCHNGDQPVTVIIPNSAQFGEIRPGWVVYFASADVTADTARVQELGGAVTYGPAVMSGYPFATCKDPQGGIFLLVGAPAA